MKDFIDCSAQTLKKIGDKKKTQNILELSKLSREGLEYNKVERRIFLYESENGHNVCLQFPGKETKWINNNFNPTDMRPKLIRPDGTVVDDLSFYTYQEHFLWPQIKKQQKSIMALSVEHFKMAYMLSHKKVKKEFYYEDINVQTGEIVAKGYIKMELYLYQPNKQVLNQLKFKQEDLFDCELLPFLIYFDLIAQNEDCKYNYFAIRDGNKWDTNKGRRNTHFSQIAYIMSGLGFISPGEYSRSMKQGGSEGQKKESIHVIKFARVQEFIKFCLRRKGDTQKVSPICLQKLKIVMRKNKNPKTLRKLL